MACLAKSHDADKAIHHAKKMGSVSRRCLNRLPFHHLTLPGAAAPKLKSAIRPLALLLQGLRAVLWAMLGRKDAP
jgi:hypothetical protein